MRKLFFTAVLTFVPALSLATEYLLPEPAPVLTPEKSAPQPNKAEERERRVKTSFRQHYASEGRPSIAIFWNRSFIDVFSQWEATERSTSEQTMSGRPMGSTNSDNDEEKKEGEKENYDCSFYLRHTDAGECTYTQRSYNEKRIEGDPEEGEVKFNNRLDQFQFGAGYTQAFLSVGADLIDRPTIMRLVERHNQKSRGTETVPDYYRIEADALVGHADYICEILLAEDPGNDIGNVSYMISIKKVTTGRIIAMFTTNGHTEDSVVEQSHWEAGPNGYRKVTTRTADELGMTDIGQNVAFETMSALVSAWENR